MNATQDPGKLLDAIALSSLPEKAMIARMAQRYLGRDFTMVEARIAVRTLLPQRGDLERLAGLLLTEVRRQAKLHNVRQARKFRAQALARPIYERLPTAESRHEAHIQFAMREFTDYVSAVFNDDAISMLGLLAGEARAYNVKWLDGGIRPTASALIEVEIIAADDKYKKLAARFLIYKVPGTDDVRCAECVDATCENVKVAFADQVPDEVLALRCAGNAVRTDFANQTFEAAGQTFPWVGKADE